MATYNVHVTQSSLFFPDTISGSQSTTFAIGNNGLAQSYFVLETVPLYTTSTPKNTSGSFTLGSGLSGLIQNDYFTSVVVNPGGGNLTFVPAIPVTGSTLMMKGMGSRNDALQAQSIVTNFTTAVRAAGGEITGSEYTALLDLTSDLISYNLLPKMKAAYPIVSSQRNLLSYTEDFSNAYWSVNTATKTPNYGVAPDGSTTACRFYGGGYMQTTGVPKEIGTYVFSFYVKMTSGSAGTLRVFLDGGITTTTVNVTAAWTRVQVSQTFSSTLIGTEGFYVDSDVLIWDPQLELGSIATDYQRTLGLADDIYKNSFKFNLVNPALFSGSFSNGWTFSSKGMTPNGSSAFFNTTLTPSTNLSLNSAHISSYIRTTNSGNQVYIGGYGSAGSSTNLMYLLNYGFVSINSTDTFGTNVAGQNGFFLNTRTSATNTIQYKNATALSTIATTSTGAPDAPLYVGAYNQNNGTPSLYSNNQTAFVSIGDGLTTTDAFLLYLAVQRYQTALNRQV